jgi:hypothetical protein
VIHERLKAYAARHNKIYAGLCNEILGEFLQKVDEEERKANMGNASLVVQDWMELSERGLWIVDDLILDPHIKQSGCVVKDRGQFYAIRYRGFERSVVEPLPHFIDSSAYERPPYNHDYFIRGIAPRKGWQAPEIGRAATKEEFDELVKRLELSEDDISDEFEVILGNVYGGSGQVTYKAKQIRVQSNEITLESELRETGIQASAPAPKRINVRVE